MNDLSHNFDAAARNFAQFPVENQLKAHEIRKAFHARLQILAEAQRALPAPVPVLPEKSQVRDWLFLGTPLDWQMTKAAAAEREREAKAKIIHIAKIQKAVCAKFNVTLCDMLGRSRTMGIVLPRQVAVYLAKILTSKSLPEIARKFGGRDHTTALSSIRKIQRLMSSDPILASAIEGLKAELTGAVQ